MRKVRFFTLIYDKKIPPIFIHSQSILAQIGNFFINLTFLELSLYLCFTYPTY